MELKWEVGAKYADTHGHTLTCTEIDYKGKRVRLAYIDNFKGSWHNWDGSFSPDPAYNIVCRIEDSKMDSDKITKKIDSMDALCSKGKQQVKELIAELFPEYKLAPRVKPGQVYRYHQSATTIKYYLVAATGTNLYSLINITDSSKWLARDVLIKSLDELTSYISEGGLSLQLAFETLDDYIKWYVNK